MNLLSMASKMSPQTLGKVNALCDIAKENDTLKELSLRLDGCDAREAYHILSNLSDHELRVIAALIGEANAKFNRRKGIR